MGNSRPLWLTVLAATLALFVAPAAFAESAAEAFVSTKANEALGILGDESLTLDAKKQRFRGFVDEVADVPRISRFVLGRYSRGVEAGELAEFTDAFRTYATSIYEEYLGQYSGETLTVTGSTERAPGDVVVHSRISGGDSLPDCDATGEFLLVNWRVLTSPDNGEMRVVDVEICGNWVAIGQRDEIVAIIQNNRGRVTAATEDLRRRATERES